MLWICVLGKTTFSSYVGLKTVSYTAVCVLIVVRLYRPGRQFTQSTPSGTESKNFSLYALQLDKEDFNCTLLTYTSCCVCVRHTVVILVYGIADSSIMCLKVVAEGLFRKSTNFYQTEKYQIFVVFVSLNRSSHW